MVLPAPGGTDQQDIVASGAGDFQGALGGELAAHIAQVHGVLAGFGEHLRRVHRNRLKRFRGID
jgi:hypothetical protein